MPAHPEPQINIPEVIAQHAKNLSADLPEGMKTLIVAFDEALPDLPLMACNATRGAVLAVLRRVIVDIEKAPAANRQARRAEAAQEKAAPRQKGVMEAGWGEYGSTFLPPTAPVVQRVEMKKAFYMGASYLMQALTELGTGDPLEDERLVAGITEEFDAFNAHQADLRKSR